MYSIPQSGLTGRLADLRLLSLALAQLLQRQTADGALNDDSALSLLLGDGLNLHLLVVATPSLGPTQVGSLLLLVVQAGALVVDERYQLNQTKKPTQNC